MGAADRAAGSRAARARTGPPTVAGGQPRRVSPRAGCPRGARGVGLGRGCGPVRDRPARRGRRVDAYLGGARAGRDARAGCRTRRPRARRARRGNRRCPTVAHAEVLGVPLRLAPWEPRYVLATYRPDRVEAPSPDLPPGRSSSTRCPCRDLLSSRRGPEATPRSRARSVICVRGWTASSEGRARVTSVEGDAGAALAALGVAERGAGAARSRRGDRVARMGRRERRPPRSASRRGRRPRPRVGRGRRAGRVRSGGVARTRPVG